jgi:hypothetical protein
VTAAAAPARQLPAAWRFPLLVFAAATVAVFVAAQLAVHHLSVDVQPHSWPDHPWLGVLARWDSGWYWHIARQGYFYDGPGQQSAVAFFPAYPFGMRALDRVLPGDLIVAGVVLTLVAGAIAATLFHGWVRDAFDERTARIATVLLVLFPFSYYLLGAVYSDALFLAAAIAAFVLLERDHPALAALAGVLATAARPIGIALVAGLFLRSLELHGVLPGAPLRSGRRRPWWPWPVRLRRLHWRDAVVLLSAAGFVSFCALLWWRFGEPFAFVKVETAEGWERRLDLQTLTMHDYFALVQGYGFNLVTWALTVQGVCTVAVLATVPAVVRRLGWSYAAYVVLGVGVPLLTSSDFFGMGRYVLVGFPAFAILGDWLRRAPLAVRATVLSLSGTLLLLYGSLFARWYLLA